MLRADCLINGGWACVFFFLKRERGKKRCLREGVFRGAGIPSRGARRCKVASAPCRAVNWVAEGGVCVRRHCFSSS